MSSKKARLVVACVIILLLLPVVMPSQYGTDSTEYRNTGSNDNYDDQVKDTKRNSNPDIISLNGGEVDRLPDFICENDESKSSTRPESPFALADVDSSKPNITAVYYQNMTMGDQGWVTWMQPSGNVRVWFKVKGPLSTSGPEIRIRVDSVKSESSEWGLAPLGEWIVSVVDRGVNESVWFYVDITLPDESSGNYGWGTDKVNAFTLALFQPFIIFVQDFEEFYAGLYDKGSYLHMFGEVHIRGINWYNYTYDSSSPEFFPCTVAERNWAVFAEFDYWIMNAPVWDIGFKSYYYRDIVWWPDEVLFASDDFMITKLAPGSYVHRPLTGVAWAGWLLDEDWAYGSLIGQTPGLYMKLHFYSGGAWNEFYNSKDTGELLRLVENILEQAPQIEILSPLDGEVIEQSTTSLRALISDPNSNQQIQSVDLYVNGIGYSATSLYNKLTGHLEIDVDIPQGIGIVNITLLATDTTGLEARSTLLVTSDSPMSYFPSSYTSSYQHYMKTLASQTFTWEHALTFSTGSDLNITLNPRVEVGFDFTLDFDLYYSRPTLATAGDTMTTYVSVTDPVISCAFWFTVALDYNITLLTYVTSGSLYLIDESWGASRKIPLGINILDLRYDLPGISEFIRQFTHYEIGFLDKIPLIGDFANLDLIVDIIPLLKISNLISADLAGANCHPEKSSISFVGDKMFAIAALIDETASGDTAEVLLNNVVMESVVGLDLCLNLTLNWWSRKPFNNCVEAACVERTHTAMPTRHTLEHNVGFTSSCFPDFSSNQCFAAAAQCGVGRDIRKPGLHQRHVIHPGRT